MYDELATAAESAAEWKYLRVLYDIYRKRFQQLRPVKDQNGNLLTSAEDQIKRWKNGAICLKILPFDCLSLCHVVLNFYDIWM